VVCEEAGVMDESRDLGPPPLAAMPPVGLQWTHPRATVPARDATEHPWQIPEAGACPQVAERPP
jgi:hypothetical protein